MYVQPIRPDELYHHGVKGMKWGVRRYQNSDGSYTTAGKKHYNIGAGLKDNISNIKNKWDSLPPETKAKIKRTVAISAGITAGALIGTAAYKYGIQHADKIIKAGTEIQSLSKEEGRLNKLDSGFFSTYKAGDKAAYNMNFSRKGKKFRTTARATKDMKIASPAKGKQTFEELRITNPEFKRLTDYSMDKNAARRINGRHKRKLGYDTFNYHALGSDKEDAVKAKNMFTKALKEQGYSGVIDSNDMLYSNLRSSSPSYIFGKSKLVTNTEQNKRLGALRYAASIPLGSLHVAKNRVLTAKPSEIVGVSSAVTGSLIAKEIIKNYDVKLNVKKKNK